MEDIVIIGGNVAAKSFLAAALDLHEDANFTVIRKNEKGPVPCGIPYAFGTLDSPYDNQSPDKKFLNAGVELIIDEVVDIDLEGNGVALEAGEEISFDRLVMAVGSEPILPPIPGKGLKNVVAVKKDLDYVNELNNKVEEASDIVIVGGGFTGVEIADEVMKLGDKNVSIIEQAESCLAAVFDTRHSKEAERLLKDKGINIYNEQIVAELKGNEAVEEVVLDNGEVLEADLVFLATGSRPRTELAEQAGLNVAFEAGIVVDKFMYTSYREVLAIGDCTAKVDLFTGDPSNIRMASLAAREGRIAAINLFERHLPLEPRGVTNLFSTVVDGVYFGIAGMTECQAEMENVNYEVIELEVPNRHPAKLPDMKEIKGKFIFAQNTGQLLGAQLQGNSQIAELINLLGYIIQNKETAYEIFTNNYGTHPLGTSAPGKYIIHTAARKMIKKIEE